ERAQRLGRHVADVALAAVDRLDDGLGDVDDDDRLAGLGERLGERQADVARSDDGDIAAHAREAYRAAAMRSAVRPSPYSVGASAGKRAFVRTSPRLWRSASSGSRRVFAPARTVSTHSVVLRNVTHGSPSQYASFCKPPESVTTRDASASRASISR